MVTAQLTAHKLFFIFIKNVWRVSNGSVTYQQSIQDQFLSQICQQVGLRPDDWLLRATGTHARIAFIKLI